MRQICAGEVLDEATCAKYRTLWIEQAAPGLLQKAGNLVGAVATHVAQGLPMVSAEEKAARLAACEGCDLFAKEQRTCLHATCGCNMDVKAGWKDQRCPIGRWPT